MKSLLVARYELVTMLRKPAFIVLAFGLPLLGLAVLGGISLTGSDEAVDDPSESPTEGFEVEGYVDRLQIIDQLPQDIPPGTLVEFDSEAKAREALQSGAIGSYYLIPADYLETGELQYVHPTVNPLGSRGQDWLMRRALAYNLVEGDPELLDLIWTPIATQSVDLSVVEQGATGDCDRPNANCEANALVRMLPTLVMIFLFIAMTNGASMLMRNISLEKQNRMIEILASSLSPLQIMAGKIAGLGIATLIAFGMWLLSAGVAIRLGDTVQYLPPGFAVPSELVPWAVAFFLFGFGLYGSLASGVGALVPNLRESTSAAWLLMAPLLIAYMIGLFGIGQPHSALLTALSLFPLSSPLVMVQRLSVGGVPGWQPLAALLVLAAALVAAVWVASRLFRAQNLLSGQRFTIRRLYAAFVE